MSSTLNQVYDYVNEQKYPEKINGSEKRTLRKRAENFVIKDGVLYYCMGWKQMSEEQRSNAKLREAIASEERRIKLVSAIHMNESGGGVHLGHVKVLKKLSQDYYWTGMHRDVRNILKMCHSCAMGRAMVRDSDIVDSGDEDANTSLTDTALLNYQDSADSEQLMNPNKTTESIFYAANDMEPDGKHFWDVVELEIIGPFPVSPESKRYNYVVLFLDVFSGWPEAAVVENTDLSTLIAAVFTVVCRYGVMSELRYKQSGYCRGLKRVFEEFQAVDCPVNVKLAGFSYLESRWTELRKSVEEFVVNMPMEWFRYIELCLLPYRISRAEGLDYTPSYLCLSRELRLPVCVNHQTSQQHVELHLTETQVNESTARIKEIFLNTLKASKWVSGAEEEEEEEEEEDGDSWELTQEDGEDDLTASPLTTGSTLTSTKGRGRIHRQSKGNSLNNYGNFYEAMKNNLLGHGYPPNYSLCMKRSMRKVKTCFQILEDKLYYKGTKGVLKEVVIYDEDRWRVLQQCHVDSSGRHLHVRETYSKVSKHFYWKGISLDTQAFTRACPQCEENATKLKHAPTSTVDKPSRETGRGVCDFYSDCTEDYMTLLEYLNNKTLPPGLSNKKTIAFKTRVNQYSLGDDGILYYKDTNYVDKSGNRLMRKVIFTPDEKEKCIKECHVIETTGKHKTKSTTHSSVSLKYYWPNMSQEVAKFMQRCEVCMAPPSGETTPAADPGTPVRVTPARRGRPRTRAISSAEAHAVTPKESASQSKRIKLEVDQEERKERFARLFKANLVASGSIEDVQSDHRYSIQSSRKPADMSCDSIQASMSDIAGNEVEVQSGGAASQQADVVGELLPLKSSSLEPLSAAVELALVGEKVAQATDGAKNSEQCTALSEAITPDMDSVPLTPATDGKTEGKGSGKLKCPYCHMVFRGPIKLQVHLSSHTGEKPFTCKICGAKVRTIKSIRHHEQRHRGELIGRRYLCDVCGKEFKSKVRLRSHKKTAHKKICASPSCNKSFSSQVFLDKHKQACSTAEALECKICDRVCSTPSEYRSHVLSHAGLEVRQRLERVGPGEASERVTVEDTMTAAPGVVEQREREGEEEEEGLVQIKIEIPEGMELASGDTQYHIQETVAGQHQDIIVTQSADNVADTVLTGQGQLEATFVELADQVAQSGLEQREIRYQILYPDNTSEIVILQHDLTDSTEQ